MPRLGWFPQFVPKYWFFFVEPLEVLGSVTQHLSSMDDIGQHFFCGAGPRGVACGDRAFLCLVQCLPPKCTNASHVISSFLWFEGFLTFPFHKWHRFRIHPQRHRANQIELFLLCETAAPQSFESVWFLSPCLGGGLKYLLSLSLIWEKWSNLTNIFQMCWNHQLAKRLKSSWPEYFFYNSHVNALFFLLLTPKKQTIKAKQ